MVVDVEDGVAVVVLVVVELDDVVLVLVVVLVGEVVVVDVVVVTQLGVAKLIISPAPAPVPTLNTCPTFTAPSTLYQTSDPSNNVVKDEFRYSFLPLENAL